MPSSNRRGTGHEAPDRDGDDERSREQVRGQRHCGHRAEGRDEHRRDPELCAERHRDDRREAAWSRESGRDRTGDERDAELLMTGAEAVDK